MIELDDNIGKGGAIAKGIAYCDAEIVLLLAADLIGLAEHRKRSLQFVENLWPLKNQPGYSPLGGYLITGLSHRCSSENNSFSIGHDEL